MNLRQFLASSKRNAFLDHPDFRRLYVRKGHHYLHGKIRKCFDIAQIEAKNPGNGAFERLVTEIWAELAVARPDISCIYIENVFNERFRAKLISTGAKLVPDLDPPSFVYVAPFSELDDATP
jgi:hypothetical protein